MAAPVRQLVISNFFQYLLTNRFIGRLCTIKNSVNQTYYIHIGKRYALNSWVSLFDTMLCFSMELSGTVVNDNVTQKVYQQ